MEMEELTQLQISKGLVIPTPILPGEWTTGSTLKNGILVLLSRVHREVKNCKTVMRIFTILMVFLMSILMCSTDGVHQRILGLDWFLALFQGLFIDIAIASGLKAALIFGFEMLV